MAVTPIASASGDVAAGWPTINSSGANFLLAFASQLAGATLTDNRGNTWVALTEQLVSFTYRCRIWYCIGPSSPGSGHTVSDPAGGVSNARIHFFAFSASGTVTYQAESGTTDGTFAGTSCQPGSLTPSGNGALVFGGAATGSAGTAHTCSALSTGGLQSDHDGRTGLITKYLDQTTAAAINPTFNWTGSSRFTTAMAVFNIAGGGGGGGLSIPVVMNQYRQRRM